MKFSNIPGQYHFEIHQDVLTMHNVLHNRSPRLCKCYELLLGALFAPYKLVLLSVYQFLQEELLIEIDVTCNVMPRNKTMTSVNFRTFKNIEFVGQFTHED